ncbi:MAG TPA: DNA polymerase IV [Solirubrobacteraceae bacterium]|nr:DNA polymerase IV [Solirubrobacteraceae bacterium]
MSSRATILHADLDAFFASVEQRDNPSLLGRPVIVGMGVVLAASYEAKARGVKSAMGGHRALRLCPDAVVVPPRMKAYTEASRAVFDVFDDTSPQVEALSIDEAFLDTRGMERIAGTPEQIARRLRREVRERVDLPITVGVARTKFLAKVASAQAKPDGLLVVPPDGELAFLHPLPIEALWGVGPATAARMRRVGIETVAEVAQLDEGSLITLLGKGAGRKLHALAHNRDPRPVVVGRRRRSMGTQRALGRLQRSWAELDSTLCALVDRLTRRLRAADRVCRTATLRMRHLDFARSTRSHTLTEATASTVTILAAFRDLLGDARPLIESRGLTLLGITLTNLADAGAVQLALPIEQRRPSALDAALDDVRDRYGADAIKRAVLLGRNPGIEMPLLPD